MNALHAGLFHVLQDDMGVEFTAVVGLSASEPCGLFLAGALRRGEDDLREATDACAATYRRLEGAGHMLVVFDVAQSEVLEVIAEVGGTTALGAWFGSAAGAITGGTKDMEAVRAVAETKGWKHTVPRTGYGDRIPFHCPALFAQHQDPALFRRVRLSKPQIPYFSSYTGGRVLLEADDDNTLNGENFLFRSMAETARCFDAIRACVRAGHRKFVELNLKPLCVRTVEEAFAAEGVSLLDDDEGQVHCCGPSKADIQAVAEKLAE